MASIEPEIIERAAEVQPSVWEAASNTVSEAAGKPIKFEHALTVSAKVSDLRAELVGNLLQIQFAFSDVPDQFQLVVIPQATILEVAAALRGKKDPDVDDAMLADIRPTIEAIVQGICKGVGEILKAPATMSGLTVRFQEFALPENLEVHSEIVRSQIAFTGKEINGVVIWLLDPLTARFISGESVSSSGEEGSSPFGQLQASSDGKEHGPHEASSESSGLEILLDIPLEISVELGRVRMFVKEVLDLGTGSIVEIDKAAGEPVDVLVNGRVVARGEVVVIEDNFGVRITEILTPQERLNRLAEVA